MAEDRPEDELEELEEKSGWLSWFRRHPSITLAIIIVVVLVGGIYFSSRRQEQVPEPTGEEAVEEAEGESEPTGEEAGEVVVEEPEEPQEETPEEQPTEEVKEQPEEPKEEEVKGEETQVGPGITEKAEPGEGITHLARRALKAHLERTGEGGDLSAEHRVYIEDYVQNRTGREGLAVGEERAFSEDLIKEAIAASRELSPVQLENLKKYTARVSGGLV